MTVPTMALAASAASAADKALANGRSQQKPDAIRCRQPETIFIGCVS